MLFRVQQRCWPILTVQTQKYVIKGSLLEQLTIRANGVQENLRIQMFDF